jgi:hypothetical protein
VSEPLFTLTGKRHRRCDRPGGQHSAGHTCAAHADGTLDPRFDNGSAPTVTLLAGAATEWKLIIGGSSNRSTHRTQRHRPAHRRRSRRHSSIRAQVQRDRQGAALQADGKKSSAGRFYETRHRSRPHRPLNATAPWKPPSIQPAGQISCPCPAIQGNGKVVIGGEFTQLDGTDVDTSSRLNANGSLDTVFAPGTRANATDGRWP